MTRHTIEPAMLNKMASITNLVYYASVAKGTTVLAEHKIVGEDLAALAVECLEKVPPLHSRFTYTTKRRMFNFLMDDAFTYCAIMDEALGKRKAFAFLERVRDEFKLLLRSRGLDGHGLEAYGLVDDFAGVFKHLVKPLVGVPQKDIDRWEEMQDADGKDDTFLDAETSDQNHADSAADLLSPLTSSNTSKVDKKSTKHQVRGQPHKAHGINVRQVARKYNHKCSLVSYRSLICIQFNFRVYFFSTREISLQLRHFLDYK